VFSGKKESAFFPFSILLRLRPEKEIIVDTPLYSAVFSSHGAR
jgi:hypothetical protein